MKLSEKKRLAKKTPRQLARIRKRKIKAVKKRELQEVEMAQYLRDNGWTQSGPFGDVWKHDTWKPFQSNPATEFGYTMDEPGNIRKVWRTYNNEKPWKSAEVCMTLRQAYRSQMRLETSGYEAPKSLDDDLADLL